MKGKRLFALAMALCTLSPAALACKQPSPTLSAEEEEAAPLPLPEEEQETEPSAPLPEEPPKEEQEPKPKPEPEPVVERAKYIRCTGNGVNLRAGAGTGYAVLGSAEKDTSYAVVGQSGNWYKTYYRGKTAYISTAYAKVFTLEKTENTVENVIKEGYKLLGVPYVYGAVRFHDGSGRLLAGFTVQKFDCSSLMQYIFYQGAGVKMGMHSRAQVKQGKYVARKDLRRGDCIFFTNEARQDKVGVERVGHVALYLGDNYILHTASDYARIEQISAKRWSFYIETRRFM